MFLVMFLPSAETLRTVKMNIFKVTSNSVFLKYQTASTEIPQNNVLKLMANQGN